MTLRSAPARRPISADVELPPPPAFGIPDKFGEWRNMQVAAILAAHDSPKRFVFQAAPTGFGKSLAYVGQAKMGGGRSVICTSTKGLQTQLLNDFAPAGLVDIRGQNAYPCVELEPDHPGGHQPSCAEGFCHAGIACSQKEGGCKYYDAQRAAKASQLVVTNYSYWLTANRFGEGLGPVDLLVLDEGHDAPDSLSSFLAVEIEQGEVETVLHSQLIPASTPLPDWRDWASFHLGKINAILDRYVAEVKTARDSGQGVRRGLLNQVRSVKDLRQKLEAIATMKGEWVAEEAGPAAYNPSSRAKRVVKFEPIWPAPYAEQYLFRGIKKVVIFSATVRPQTARYLGIGDNDYDFNEYPSTFPIANRPVYHVPTVQVSHRTDETRMRLWVNRIDQIIRSRGDRKGVVHTTSYARRSFVIAHSEFQNIIVSHGPENTRAAIDRYKAGRPPSVLVSPSVTTGWDFPYAECEYQIIGKVPFPDTRGAVMKARAERDKDYLNYIAMQTLIQTCGRGMRAEDDQCETFIIDDNIVWFINKYRKFAPKWWLDSFKQVKFIPPAPPKLNRPTQP